MYSMERMYLSGWLIFIYPEGVIWWTILGPRRPQLEELHQYYPQEKH
jgi:hypothetical protein